jgi:hypothetical protein
MIITENLHFDDYDLQRAKEVVKKFHKHNIEPQGHKFTRAIFRAHERDLDINGEYNVWDKYKVTNKSIEDYGLDRNDPFADGKVAEEGLDSRLYYHLEKDFYFTEQDCEYFVVEPKCEYLLCGIAVVGRPISRFLDNGQTLEITRVVFPHLANSISFDLEMARRNENHASSIPSELIADVCKQAKKRGYKKIITYTRQDENGNYYKACGFKIVYKQKSVGLWKSRNGVKVNTKSSPCPKYRWEKILNA